MPYIQLTGGAYQARSIIAAAQRCLNLYPETLARNTGEPVQVTHYCTPGLTLVGAAPYNGCRGLYTTTTGELYACYDQHVLHFSSDGLWTDLGKIQPSSPTDAVARDTPVRMSDNSFVLILADGTVDGYFVDITIPVAQQVLTRIDRNINTGWMGADNIIFQDTFFICNSPGTIDWYCSISNVTAQNFTAGFTVYSATIVGTGTGYNVNDVLMLNGTGGAEVTVNEVDASGAVTGYGVTAGGALNVQPANPVGVTGGTGTGATFDLTYETNTGAFDPLDFVGMSAITTNCVGMATINRLLWILGENSYEIWTNSGGDGSQYGSFPFTIYPTGFGNFGCAAKHSICTIQNTLFWLSQDKFGHGVVVVGQGLSSKRVSTYAIENAIATYDTINDAYAYVYQQQGHWFYVLTFPSANDQRGATWVYDGTSDEWHERCFIDSNGIEYKHLGATAAGVYGSVYVGDWRNGNLYVYDLDNYTDNGSPVKRLRAFPHQMDMQANRRVHYRQLIAQVQVGSPAQSSPNQLVLDCEFEATDGTLLQNYHNINSLGAGFQQILPTNAVIMNDAVVGQTPGNVMYRVSGTPNTPDYTIRYKVQPTDYSLAPPPGSIISVIGRADVNNQGYEASIFSDGAQYYVSLAVGGSVLATNTLGTIASGDYTIYLTMQSTAISVAVLRSEDSHWLAADGLWVGSAEDAISIQDGTYAQPGVVLIGGNWQ